MSSILKVDTIQNTGGTTGLTIDSGGRVLNPNTIAWSAYKDAIQTASAANERVTWATTTLNKGNGFSFSGATANAFVAPVAGVYSTSCQWLTTNTTTQVDIHLRKNGNIINRSRNSKDAASAQHQTTTITATVELAVNDYLEITISVSGQPIYGDSNLYWTTWHGHLIG